MGPETQGQGTRNIGFGVFGTFGTHIEDCGVLLSMSENRLISLSRFVFSTSSRNIYLDLMFFHDCSRLW